VKHSLSNCSLKPEVVWSTKLYSRSELFKFFFVIWITDGSNIVCESIESNVHDLFVVMGNWDASWEIFFIT